MSISQMVKVWEHEFPHPQQAVMLALADHASDDGTSIYPSIARIAWKTGYEERNVKYIMSQLRKTGVLVVTKEATPRTPNEYRIAWENAKAKPPFRGAKSAPLDAGGATQTTPGVQSSSPQGCNTAYSGVQGVAPKPSIEPSIQPSLEPSKKKDVSKSEKAQEIVDLYNEMKPPTWSICQALNDKRKRAIDSLFSEHGGETLTVFRAALVYVCTSDWWREKDMAIDSLLVKGRALEFFEKADNLKALAGLSEPNRKVVSQAQEIYNAIGGDDA